MKQIYLFIAFAACLTACTKDDGGVDPPKAFPTLTVTSPASLSASVWYQGSLDVTFNTKNADYVLVNGEKVTGNSISLSELKTSKNLIIQAVGKGGTDEKRVNITVFSQKMTFLGNPVPTSGNFRMTENVDRIVGNQSWNSHALSDVMYGYRTDGTLLMTTRNCTNNCNGTSQWRFSLNEDSIMYGPGNYNAWKIESLNQSTLVLSQIQPSLNNPSVLVELRQTFQKQ